MYIPYTHTTPRQTQAYTWMQTRVLTQTHQHMCATQACTQTTHIRTIHIVMYQTQAKIALLRAPPKVHTEVSSNTSCQHHARWHLRVRVFVLAAAPLRASVLATPGTQ